jgi:hypothetical protein
MRFPAGGSYRHRLWRALRPSCTPPRAHDRVRVAANSNSTAAGSSSSATTRIEPPQHCLVGLAEEGGEIFHRTEIGLDSTTLALHSGLFDLQVGEGLRLDRELVREAVALGLPPFVVRGAEL